MRNKENVIQWAKERGILSPDNAFKQYAKLNEEVGELGGALLKDDHEKIVDGIGDTLVTLIILSAQLGWDVEDCLEHAWNEIRDRKGKTVNGTFIKDEIAHLGICEADNCESNALFKSKTGFYFCEFHKR